MSAPDNRPGRHHARVREDWRYDLKAQRWDGPKDPPNAERSVRGLIDWRRVARANRASRQGL